MVDEHIKISSTPLIIRKMQRKSTIRYYFILTRMTIINTDINKKNCRGYGEILTFIHCQWDCKVVKLHWKTVWLFLKMLNIEWPYYPEFLLLAICQKNKNICLHKTCTRMVTAKLFIIVQKWKQHKFIKWCTDK